MKPPSVESWTVSPRVLDLFRRLGAERDDLEGAAVRTLVALLRMRAHFNDEKMLWAVDYLLVASGLARMKGIRDRAMVIVANEVADEVHAPQARGGDA